MADKKIYMQDSPKNPHLQTSPFDWTYTTNLTGRFGKVNCAMMKYLPPHTKVKVKPYFAFDMQPLVFPVQTNVRCHLKFYKVPLRILWKDFEDFASQLGTNGLPTNGGGTPFVVPYIKRETGWNALGSLAEQIGCCNRKLTSYDSLFPIDGKFVNGDLVDNANFFVPSYYGTAVGSNSLLFSLPLSSLLTKMLNGNLTDFSFSFSLLSLVSTVSSSGSVILQAFTKGNRVSHGSGLGPEEDEFLDGFDLVATTTITNLVTSVPSFNSSESSCYLRRSSQAVSINNNSLYRVLYTCKIIDEHFYSQINSLLASDNDVYLRLSFTGVLANAAFNGSVRIPDNNLVSAPIPQPQYDDNNDLKWLNPSSQILNSLGLEKSVVFAVTRVSSAIDTKFDSIGGADPQVPIPALPFRALEFIHNYFMRNPRIDPFVKDGVPTYNRFLTNDASGADSTTPVDSWNALYETDYFTSCVKEPQFGNAPLVGATVNDTSDTGILTFSDGTGYNDYTVKVNADADGNVAPLTLYEGDADHPNLHRLQELIDFGISINDLRNVSTFQRMLERMQRTEYRFANVVYEFFGTNPPVGDHYPQYLGGVTRNVTVDKITNVAESDSHPLGSFAGQGKFRGEGESISVFTTEPSYLVCIQYFTVTPTYSQYLPKHLLYKDPLDFYLNPEFAFMGPQPVYKGEVAANQVAAANFYDVFGYNRPYAELFGNVDEVHGLYKSDMANFLLQRFFGDSPELNKSFIEINSADLTNIFSVVENTDKMFGQVLFKMSAQLPAPRSYLPRSI